MPAGDAGALTSTERREKYTAQAVEYAKVHEFVRAGRQRSSKEEAIRFVCASDAQEDGSHAGFWMPLAQWNRYRHDTFKDRREDELPFIRNKAEELSPAEPPAKEPAAGILQHFEAVSTGPHPQKMKGGGIKEVECTWYTGACSLDASVRKTS